MKGFFYLLAVVALGGVVVHMAHASGRSEGEADPVFGITIPTGYRDWKLISVAHEEGNLNDLRALLGNDVAIKVYREGKPNAATPGWADPRQKSFACIVSGQNEADLFLMFNADTRSFDFTIPPLPASKIWRLAIDTSRSDPDDVFETGKEPSMQGQISFRVEPRSSAVLLNDKSEVPK